MAARNRSPHVLSLIASSLDGVGTGMLDGKRDLSVAQLQALTMDYSKPPAPPQPCESKPKPKPAPRLG
jgi:hypothetical protein